MKTLLFIAMLCVFAGCRDAAPSAPAPAPEPSPFNSFYYGDALPLSHLPTLTTPDGIRYKVVKIEGRRFIATTDFGSTWHFTGPID